MASHNEQPPVNDTVTPFPNSTPKKQPAKEKEEGFSMKKEYLTPLFLFLITGLASWCLYKVTILGEDVSSIKTEIRMSQQDATRQFNDASTDRDRQSDKLDKVDDKVDQMRVETIQALADIKFEISKSSNK